PTAAPAAVSFSLYDANGVRVGLSNQTIPAGGQLARLGSELFPRVTVPGWVQTTSSVSGLPAFWLAGDFDNYGDGAEAAAFAGDQVFPLTDGLTDPADTEISIANINPGSVFATMRLFSRTGTALTPLTNELVAPFGVLQRRISIASAGTTIIRDVTPSAASNLPFFCRSGLGARPLPSRQR
ncbi:MAG: hypothetical protein DMG14_24770, partial [Acidobacteria bacterium]